jgi:hypothetical protein
VQESFSSSSGTISAAKGPHVPFVIAFVTHRHKDEDLCQSEAECTEVKNALLHEITKDGAGHYVKFCCFTFTDADSDETLIHILHSKPARHMQLQYCICLAVSRIQAHRSLDSVLYVKNFWRSCAR